MARDDALGDTDPVLRIATDQQEVGVRLRASGEIDAASAPLLDRAIERAAEAGASLIALDLAGVEFMDSTGLSTIIAARSRYGEAMVRVVAASPPVQRTLDITGLRALLMDG